jgi:hypothetical protein
MVRDISSCYSIYFLDLDPNNYEILTNFGAILFAAGIFLFMLYFNVSQSLGILDEALIKLKQAVAIRPDSESANFNIGM